MVAERFLIINILPTKYIDRDVVYDMCVCSWEGLYVA